MHCQNSTFPIENPDPEAVKMKRCEGLRKLRMLSIGMMSISSIGIVCGILTFVYASPNLKFPFSWGGDTVPSILVFVSGLLGFLAVQDGLKDEPSPKFRCRISAQHTLAVIGTTFSFIGLGYAIAGLTICLTHGKDCLPNKRENTILAAINIVLGIALASLCIWSSCFFCCYRRTYGCLTKKEKAKNMQVQVFQNQPGVQQIQAQGQVQGVAPPPYPGLQQNPVDQGQPSTGFSYGTEFNTKY